MTTTLSAPTGRHAATAAPIPQVSNHIPFQQTVANSLTMAYRGILKIKHNPEQLFDVTVQPILFTALFAYIFGSAIAAPPGVSYREFLIPGIFVQTVVFGAIILGVYGQRGPGSVLGNAQRPVRSAAVTVR